MHLRHDIVVLLNQISWHSDLASCMRSQIYWLSNIRKGEELFVWTNDGQKTYWMQAH